jgi:hypothetical protein
MGSSIDPINRKVIIMSPLHFPKSAYETTFPAGLRRSNGPLARGGLTMLAGGFASLFLILAGLQSTDASPANGNMRIEQPALDSTIRLETSARFGGSVASIVFRGKQFVDVHDHGRELQSASSFDGFGECFNPTEAGSLTDDVKETTSSKLLAARSGPNSIETETDMAFWLPPNYDYRHQCGHSPGTTHAVNKAITGGHILDKRIELGEGGISNVIGDHVTYTVPEPHQSGTFEAATLYTPSDFSKRYVLNFGTGNVEPTSVIGEQQYPVILATPDGKYAVGEFSPSRPQPGYGTFTFANTNKINCVYRESLVAAGQKFSYLCDFVIGTLDEVKVTILDLHSRMAH